MFFKVPPNHVAKSYSTCRVLLLLLLLLFLGGIGYVETVQCLQLLSRNARDIPRSEITKRLTNLYLQLVIEEAVERDDEPETASRKLCI